MVDFDPDAKPAVQSQQGPQMVPETKQKFSSVEQQGNKLTRNTAHVWAIIFDCLFTAFPLIYGLVTVFVSNINMAISYILYGIFIAIYYYNTQNFAGRFLGRMRWATYVVEGKQYYYFESMSTEGQSRLDIWIFWICLVFTALYYPVATVAYIFVPGQWFSIPITVVGAIAGWTQLIAFIKCSQDARRKMREMSTDLVAKVAVQAMQGL